MVDANGDGEVTLKEVRQAVAGMDEEEAQIYIDDAAEADTDGNLAVNFDEFKAWYYGKMMDGDDSDDEDDDDDDDDSDCLLYTSPSPRD